MTLQKGKPMYTGASLNKNTLTQEQFTRELATRLEQLSLECSTLHNTDEYSDSSFSPPSITWPKKVCTNHINKSCSHIHTDSDKIYNERQNYHRQQQPQKQTLRTKSSPRNRRIHKTIQVHPESNQKQVSNCTQKKKEENFKNNQAMNTTTNSFSSTWRDISYSPDKYIPKKSFPDSIRKQCQTYSEDMLKSNNVSSDHYQRKEQCNSAASIKQKHPNNKFIEQNKQINDQSSDHSEVNHEMECLEDDNLIIDDNSTTDISDSEVSCARRLSNLPDEVIPPVITSLFPNTPSVLRFADAGQVVQKLPKQYRSRLLWRPSAITPNVVKRVLKRSNFRMTLKSSEWIGYYGNHLKPFGFRPIRQYQKVNHFPGSFQLGRKDKLWINLNQMRSYFGKKSIDFVPRTFCLPTDLKLLKEFWSRYETPNSTSSNIDGLSTVNTRPRWIMKPPASARGIGIKLIRSWSDIPKQRRVLVQSYINQPYLIDGTKFDIRLYVYVAGFSPFRAYVYREGLVRFASQRYSTSFQHLGNRFVHLTNYSINKHNKSDENSVSNHKWKLSKLWSYLTERGVDVPSLWSCITDIIFKTLASVVSCITTMVDQNCRRRASVYELFGFDIILDADLKPWLLEVNVSPSLHTNTQLDDEVKTSVVKDMFNLCGFQLPPDYRSSQLSSSTTTPSKLTPNSKNTNSNASAIAGSSFNEKNQFSSWSHYITSNNNNNNNDTDNGQLSNKCLFNSSNSNNSQHHHHQPHHNSSASLLTTLQRGNYSPSGLPPPSPSINSSNNIHVKRSQSSLSTRMTSNKMSEKNCSDSCLPITDPRLWDISLSTEDKRKHLFYSSLMTDKEKNKTRQLSDKLSKSNKKNILNAGDNSKDPINSLRHMLSELTPDDLRTLTNLIDERYRAALGNFQCIFPLHGSEGYRLLTFLQTAYQKNIHTGTLGSRSPSVYYYDILQYVFLTVYHNTENDENLCCESFTHQSVDKDLPDQTTLMSGELTPEIMSLVCRMTGVSKTGLDYLINLCKKGIHLMTTEYTPKSNQVFWTQTSTPASSINQDSRHSSRYHYHRIDTSPSSLFRQSESYSKNSQERQNNLRNTNRPEKRSIQTQSITPTSYDNESQSEIIKSQSSQEVYSLDKPPTPPGKMFTVRQPSYRQPHHQQQQRRIRSSCGNLVKLTKEKRIQCSNLKPYRTESDFNVRKVKHPVKRSSSTSDILLYKKYSTNSPSIISNSSSMTNSNENIYKSNNKKLIKTPVVPKTASCDSNWIRNTNSARYSTSSTLSSSSSIAATAAITDQCLPHKVKFNQTYNLSPKQHNNQNDLRRLTKPLSDQYNRSDNFSNSADFYDVGDDDGDDGDEDYDIDDQTYTVYKLQESKKPFLCQIYSHTGHQQKNNRQYQYVNSLPVKLYPKETRIILERHNSRSGSFKQNLEKNKVLSAVQNKFINSTCHLLNEPKSSDRPIKIVKLKATQSTD
uniref:Tubulin polyglutamylase TTLL4 n=1 Tax=Trichobilharzia regenti TaxID=157069 RepID=A0AA85JW61_TRIRE|nr:unnamed protein product [Trichobilharzia regenti]